jgi:hypothetical protein
MISYRVGVVPQQSSVCQSSVPLDFRASPIK